jgi:tetratricopeptide (TPR) repeat protein
LLVRRFHRCQRGPLPPFPLLLALALSLGGLGGGAAPAGAQGKPLAKLISYGLLTDVLRALQGSPAGKAHRGMPLHPGYVIRTDPSGRAEVLFDDGTQMKINVRTILELLASRSRPVRVIRGQVFLRARSELRINTPTADCHVYGTDLSLEVSEDGTTTLRVVEGAVEFSNPRGRVVVREGLQSTARLGEAPTPPRPAVNLPNIIQWTDDVQPVALSLEVRFLGQDPSRLPAALRAAEALPPGPERSLQLGDARHDLAASATDVAHGSELLTQAQEAYQAALDSLPPTALPAQRARLQARLGQTWLEAGEVPKASAAFAESLRLEPGETLARVGQVMALLSQRHLEADQQALAEASEGVRRDGSSAVAHTARALALIRLERRPEALQELAEALRQDPTYAQALAWQSFLFRTAERQEEARASAQAAVTAAPASSLAQQALADALFAAGDARAARGGAARAVALSPLSAGAHVSLGRALLQEGRLDAAAREGFQAVALDPSLDRAHFFLGLALWEQRRLVRAESELKKALDLDPGYLEATAYLARVYVAEGEGRRARAVAEAALQEARAQNPAFEQSRDPRWASVRAALGEVDFQAGMLKEAEREYGAALALAPGAPGYELALARVYLEENDLPDALWHGLRGVNAAPQSHEAHALLGLVYQRRSDTEQAEREYREALSLYPDDALARLGLGTTVPNAGERVREIRRVVKNQPDVSYSAADTGDTLREVEQAMLRDPAVVMQVFKPGKTAEIAPEGGSNASYGLGLTHRDLYSRGKLYDLSFADREHDENYRNDRPEERTFGWLNLTAAPGYRTHVLGQYLFTGQVKALPGATDSPTPNGRSSFHENEWDLSARHQIDPATFAWFHAGYHPSASTELDPDTLGDSFALLTTPTLSSLTRRRALGVESRLDHLWGGGHTTSYVLFAGRNQIENPQLRYQRPTRQFDQIDETFVRDQVVTHTLQHEYSPGSRFSLILGATAERFTSRFRTEEPGGIVLPSPATAETRWLPYGEATYVLTRRDLIRAIAHRRGQRGFEPLLPPAEAFLTDEFPALEAGGQETNYELDYERRVSPRAFGKLFVYSGDVKDFILLPAVTQNANPFILAGQNGPQLFSLGFVVPAARVRGIGARYEYQVGRLLSSYWHYTYREFTDETPAGTESDPRPGRQIPLNPRSSAVLGLSYIDRAGTKLFLEADGSGGQYEGADRLSKWGKLPEQWVANFRLAKEPSLRQEWELDIDNLFNTGTIYWPGFPAPGRSYRVQYRVRF